MLSAFFSSLLSLQTNASGHTRHRCHAANDPSMHAALQMLVTPVVTSENWGLHVLALLVCLFSGLCLSQSVSTELVNADRTALFLVDDKKEELYAYVFSVGPNESDYVKRVVDTEHSSVEDYINQLGTTLREVVSYRGKLVRYTHAVCAHA